MKLQRAPFEKIKSKTKVIEVRLFDEKRAKLKVGDIIIFTNLNDENEKVKVRISGLHNFKSFAMLFDAFPAEDLGCQIGMSEERYVESMYTIYTQDDERKYGVLGIRIELI